MKTSFRYGCGFKFLKFLHKGTLGLYIDDTDVPVLYFPTGHLPAKTNTGDVAKKLQYSCIESVMGHYFEAQLPSTISISIEIKVKKLQ